MPKMKTKSGAAKRLKPLKSGKFKCQRAGRRHLLSSTTPAQSRAMRKSTYINDADLKKVRAMMPYA